MDGPTVRRTNRPTEWLIESRLSIKLDWDIFSYSVDIRDWNKNKAIAISRVLSLQKCEKMWKIVKNCETCENL